mmetsp:Transcript_28570/g.54562  ORF Transcript_28570/g.54562 Transcript_28570/m.54562 type:complete len:215 (+) Transcript_28570:2390-3034(+)
MGGVAESYRSSRAIPPSSSCSTSASDTSAFFPNPGAAPLLDVCLRGVNPRPFFILLRMPLLVDFTLPPLGAGWNRSSWYIGNSSRASTSQDTELWWEPAGCSAYGSRLYRGLGRDGSSCSMGGGTLCAALRQSSTNCRCGGTGNTVAQGWWFEYMCMRGLTRLVLMNSRSRKLSSLGAKDMVSSGGKGVPSCRRTAWPVGLYILPPGLGAVPGL